MKKISSKILILTMLVAVLPNVSFAEQEKSEKAHNVGTNSINRREIEKKYDVIPTFVSGTAGKKLPDGVENQIPQSAIDAPKGFKYKLKTDFKEVKADGGIWKFKRWEKVNSDGTKTVVNNEVQIVNEDIKLQGVWEFEKEGQVNKFKVVYRFIAVPDDRDLPEAVKNKKPADKYNVPSGTKITLPKFDDVKVEGGTWKFITWKVPKNNQVEPIENEAIVENDDLILQGEWKFVKDNQEQPNPQAYKWVQNDNGKWSYQSADGKYKVKDSWKFINNEWYLFDKDGYMIANSWVKDNGKWYYLEETGSMSKSEWVYKDGSWFYAKSNGSIAEKEWVYVGGNWFYAKSGGYIAENQWVYEGGNWFYAKSNGYIVENEWIFVGGKWYYAQKGGYIAQGKTLRIRNVDYTFDNSGAWIR